MVERIDVPLTDPRISFEMRRFMERHDYKAVEIVGHGLFVIGEEDGEVFELGYNLFCAVTRRYFAEELLGAN